MNAPGNLFEPPIPRGIPLLQATLRVGTAVQALGLALAILGQGRISSLLEYWMQVYELPLERAVQMDHRIAWGLLIAAAFTLVRPAWFMLIPLGVYQVAIAVAAGVLDPEGRFWVVVADQACQFSLPWALLLIDFWPGNIRPTLPFTLTSVGLLRGATIAACVSGGMTALRTFAHGGPLVDRVLTAAGNLGMPELSPDHARNVLAVMGVLQLTGATCLLLSRHRIAAALLTAWGFFEAFSPILAAGQAGADQALISFGDGAAPLTVLLFWLLAVQEGASRWVPEGNSPPQP